MIPPKIGLTRGQDRRLPQNGFREGAGRGGVIACNGLLATKVAAQKINNSCAFIIAGHEKY